MSAENGSQEGRPRLAPLADPRGRAAEAYRTLSVNIRFGRFEQPPRTILFTSATADDGASTTVANVAVAAAQANASVVVVDADLRRPGLHEIFGIANATGLTTLSDGMTDTPAQSTGIERLRVVTSGPATASPAELLSSERLLHLLARLRADADLVLVTAPPVTAGADASLLAVRVDGVVLVVDAHRTRRQDAHRAKTQLERVNARILGVVLTNASGMD